MTRPLRIVDAHIHLWDLDRNYYPWLAQGDRPSVVKDYSSLRRNYVPADFWRDAQSLAPDMEVLGVVHIQAEHDPNEHVRETRWLQEIAGSEGSRGIPQAIVGNADLAAPNAEQVLSEHCAHANMRGIRQALHRRLEAQPPYDPLQDPAFQRNVPLLARHGLSFDLQYYQQQGEAVAALVRANPDVQFILTHAGMPLQQDAAYLELWRSNLTRLAQYPNVAVKISGLGMLDPQWDHAGLKTVADLCIDLFTPTRCMLASNFPVERIHRSYKFVWQAYADHFRHHSQAEQDALFFGNATRYYRIDPARLAPPGAGTTTTQETNQ
jgi:predicted TIM-barrel fold metal-dependent hydrolase